MLPLVPITRSARKSPRGKPLHAVLAASLAAVLFVPVGALAAPVGASVSEQGSLPGAFSLGAIVAEAAQRFGITQNWIWAVMRVESGGKTRAVSPKGAMGLMQIMPATWTKMTARYRLGGDPFDMRANVHAGAAYLREMFDRYGDLGAALAAYNAGPGRADDWRWRGRPLPAETTAYVARIAPTIGAAGPVADGIAPLTVATFRPVAVAPSWRASGLFTRRAEGNAAVDLAPSDRARRSDSSSASIRATGLYVVTGGKDRR